MAQDITQKQQAFVSRYQGHLGALRNAVNALVEDKAEWDAMGYATGAAAVQGVNWNIPDAQVQAAVPAGTAAILNSAVGGVASVVTTYQANTGYLYPLMS